MTISGGIKFFRKSYADIDYEAAVVTMTSGSSSRNNMRDRKPHTRAQSVGSSDATTETWTVTFDAAHLINRLILRKHNFKDFKAEYWDGVAWADFTNVVTKEGTQASITETACTKTTSYYEFAAVTTDQVRLTLNTTQTADAEKFLGELVVTEELGTFQSYPALRPKLQTNQVQKETLGGRFSFTVMGETFAGDLDFSNHTNEADNELIVSLWEGQEPFLIYPSGGNGDQFRFAVPPYRLEDLYLVWFTSEFDPFHTQNVYALGLNYSLSLVEVT